MLEIFRFDLRENPKTGKPQWQARRKGRDGTTCYIVPDESPRFPLYEQDVWLCEVGPVFLSPDRKFPVAPVQLIAPWPERMELLFVLGERDGKPHWSALGRVGPVEVTFVVHKDSEKTPDEKNPVWDCRPSNFIIAQQHLRAGRHRIIVPVRLETPVEIELQTLIFTEGSDPEGRPQFYCELTRNGTSVKYVVDRGHYLRVENSGQNYWRCAFHRMLGQNDRSRLIAVIPFAPARPSSLPPSPDKAVKLEAERLEAQKRAAEHQARNAQRSNGGKKRGGKKAATT